jgi:hypothetical protein
MEELLKKIDFVVQQIHLQNNNLENQIQLSTLKLKNMQSGEIQNEKQYHYNLELCNANILINKDRMKKNEFYIRRCKAYKEYIQSLQLNDPLVSEKNKFQFIRIFQEETIYQFDSKLTELNQRKVMENITGSKSNLSEERKKVILDRESTIEKFLNDDFSFDSDKIYTPYYLNYNTEELIDSLYLTKENRKVA